MGALRRDPRATETEPRKSGGRTRDLERKRGIVGTPCGREDGGRTEEDEGGENWREPTQGKEGKGRNRRKRRRKEEKRNQRQRGKPKQGRVLSREIHEGKEIGTGSGVGNKVRELDARKGKERRKHERTRAERSVEEVVSDRGENGENSRRRNGEREEGGDPLREDE